MKRIFLIVLDSFGIGEMPDAANYGDEGSNTLGTVAKSPEFSMPNMAKLGLFNIDGVTAKTPCAKPGRHRCTYDGAVCRKGYDYRTLGDRRTDLKETDAHLSKWFSTGISGGIFKGRRP